MPLTSEETALLRAETQIWYTDRCTIERYVRQDDAFGGSGDSTPDIVGTDIPCMIESGAGQEQLAEFMGVLQVEAEFLIALPAEYDVRVEDHLVVTTKGNLRLEVQALLAPESIEIDRMIVANRLATTP